MFDVGLSELALIALLALILLGPKRLPEVARAAGKTLARVRHFVNNVKSDLDAELRNAEIMELQRLKQELDDTRQAIERSSSGLLDNIARSAEPPAVSADAGAPAMPPALNEPVTAAAPKKSAAKRRRTAKTKKKHGRSRKVAGK